MCFFTAYNKKSVISAFRAFLGRDKTINTFKNECKNESIPRDRYIVKVKFSETWLFWDKKNTWIWWCNWFEIENFYLSAAIVLYRGQLFPVIAAVAMEILAVVLNRGKNNYTI